MTTLAAVFALLGADEAALRDAFSREFKAKDAAKRVEAVKKLSGAKEEKSLLLLAGALKDPDKLVKKAAAEAIGAGEDAGGVAVKELCAVLVSKEEDPEARLACARALGKARYRTDAIDAMINAISNILNTERHLHQFGADVTEVLEKMTGENFKREKVTPQLWQNWWKDNKEKIKQEDEKKREEYKKAQKK
jgi:HEAT repeat protein